MHPALKKRRDGFWIRRALLVCAVLLGAFAIYALSFGPVLKLCGAKPSTGWSGLPAAIRVFYSPLAHIPEPLAGALDHYEQWWIGVE
jgi:hypothetical protein